jgi:hypothetical protein
MRVLRSRGTLRTERTDVFTSSTSTPRNIALYFTPTCREEHRGRHHAASRGTSDPALVRFQFLIDHNVHH